MNKFPISQKYGENWPIMVSFDPFGLFIFLQNHAVLDYKYSIYSLPKGIIDPSKRTCMILILRDLLILSLQQIFIPHVPLGNWPYTIGHFDLKHTHVIQDILILILQGMLILILVYSFISSLLTKKILVREAFNTLNCWKGWLNRTVLQGLLSEQIQKIYALPAQS